MAQKERHIEVKVGALILVCTGLLIAFLFLLGDFKTSESATIQVDFESSVGLKVGALVKVAGLRAGRVEEIEFRQRDGGEERPLYVRVHLTMRPDLRAALKRDAAFYITTLGLLGEKYVEVDPGRAAEALPEDTVVVGSPPMRLEVMTARVEEFLRRGNKILADNELAIKETIVDVRAAAQQGRKLMESAGAMVADARKDLRRIVDKGMLLIDGADKTLATVRSAVDEYTPGKGKTGDVIARIAKSGASVAEKVDRGLGDGSELRAIVADGRALVRRLRRFVDETSDKVGGFVKKVEVLVADAGAFVRDGKGQVAQIGARVTGLLDDARVVMTNLKDGRGTVGALLSDREMYDDIREIMKDLKRHPWKFLWKE